MGQNHEHTALLPEWGYADNDDSDWVAALEANRDEVYAELATL